MYSHDIKYNVEFFVIIKHKRNDRKIGSSFDTLASQLEKLARQVETLSRLLARWHVKMRCWHAFSTLARWHAGTLAHKPR